MVAALVHAELYVKTAGGGKDRRDHFYLIMVLPLDGDAPIWMGRAPGGEQMAMGMSPDGAMIATGDEHGTVFLWRREPANPSSWAGPQELLGHKGFVTGAAFSRDGLLATSAADLTVRLWNGPTGAPVSTIPTQTKGRPQAIALRPDGSLLVMGGKNGEVKAWKRGPPPK